MVTVELGKICILEEKNMMPVSNEKNNLEKKKKKHLRVWDIVLFQTYGFI